VVHCRANVFTEVKHEEKDHMVLVLNVQSAGYFLVNVETTVAAIGTYLSIAFALHELRNFDIDIVIMKLLQQVVVLLQDLNFEFHLFLMLR
jgi:hypothetical protein